MVLCLALLASLAHCEDAMRLRASVTQADGSIRTCHGTCFPVTKQIVATCWHVVEDGGDVTVEKDGKWLSGNVISLDKELDICLVEVKDAGFKAMNLLPLGSLTVSGSAKGQPIANESATVCDIFLACKDPSVGVSGAPVSVGGRVVAMVKSVIYDEGKAPVYRCTPVTAIAKMLEDRKSKEDDHD